MAPKKKAHGVRGSWFATVDGESLPVLHSYWSKREAGDFLYHDVNFTPDYPRGGQPEKFIDAIKSGTQAVLAKSEPQGDDDSADTFERKGYIAVFEYEYLSQDERGLRLRFTDRVIELN